jgi:phosphate transport system substrate-binding protein
MNIRAISFAAVLALLSATALAAGVQITTNDGNVVRGELVSLTDGIYTIKTPYGTITIPAASVKKIDSDAPPGPGPNPADNTASGPQPLRLAGSTTIGDELAEKLLEGFATSKGATDLNWTRESQSEVTLEGKGANNASFSAHISRHGSGTAFTSLADGKADIGMASRRVNAKEVDLLRTKGLGEFQKPGQENVVALDGLIVIVNRKNPKEGLSVSDIRDIFSGKITDWSQVGGDAGKIDVYVRDKNSGTYDTFNALAMAGQPLAITATTVGGSDEMSDKVQSDPNGIGYDGFAFLNNNKALTIGTDCGIAYPADELYVRTEEYPLSRRLYLYQAQSPTNPDQQAFIDYSLGNDGQQLVAKNHFVDLSPNVAALFLGRQAVAINFVDLSQSRGAIALDFQLFALFAQRATYGNRVTTTFRFATDSSELDSRAVRDIDRLADYLKTVNRKVLIAGFTDNVGDPNYNAKLSTDRANQIAELLRQRGAQPSEVRGFGRVAPVACNTSPEGRDKNRRVEVWLY